MTRRPAGGRRASAWFVRTRSTAATSRRRCRAALLVFNVKQGWRPLCEFLEVAACPTTPFPHVMTSFEMQVVTVVMRTVTWVWPLLPLVPLLLL